MTNNQSTLISLISSQDVISLSKRMDLIPLFNTQLTGSFTNDKMTIINPYPIQLVVFTGNQSIVELFLNAGADPNKCDRNSTTPSAINIAVLLNLNTIIQVLVLKGADLEARNLQNLTPLHISLIYSDFSTFQQLLYIGANVYATNPQGETVLQAAFNSKKMQHYQFLVSVFLPFQQQQMLIRQQQQQHNFQTSMWVDTEQFNALQKRVITLEQVLSKALSELPGNAIIGCGLCHSCHSKEGNVICPVCHMPFCHLDWITHVMNGCQNSQ